ncbi:MAG: hypothetical protein KF774_17055 [Planctomyces sp.]|nr:hypothetical protein [Planctomyces sp.]
MKRRPHRDAPRRTGRPDRSRPSGAPPQSSRPPAASRAPASEAAHDEDANGRSGTRRGQHADEQKYHGRHACRALFEERPDDIIRVYVARERMKEFSELLKWCAARRRAYHIVEGENLERLAETVHHQGIIVLAKKPRSAGEADFARRLAGGELAGPVLLLDGVQNPHNLGSILRTSANFGVRAVLGRVEELPSVTASAARVAEGGAERVPVLRLRDPREALNALKAAGHRVCVATNHPGGNVYEAALPANCVIVLGNEVSGVSPAIAALADASLQIPGSGAVESLNVAVACGILLSEIVRRHGLKPPPGALRPPAEPDRPSRGKSRRAR